MDILFNFIESNGTWLNVAVIGLILMAVTLGLFNCIDCFFDWIEKRAEKQVESSHRESHHGAANHGAVSPFDSIHRTVQWNRINKRITDNRKAGKINRMK